MAGITPRSRTLSFRYPSKIEPGNESGKGKYYVLSIEKCAVPANTRLAKYCRNGSYADCYRTEIGKQISLNQFVFAFYTTFLFKLERFILNWTVAEPSTDFQVRELIEGDIEKFAAWSVEARNENELLMCDFAGRTRSWFMAVPIDASGIRTRLYFGSVVVSVQDPKTGKQSIGFLFQTFVGFHQIYSVLLLYAAKLHIKRRL